MNRDSISFALFVPLSMSTRKNRELILGGRSVFFKPFLFKVPFEEIQEKRTSRTNRVFVVAKFSLSLVSFSICWAILIRQNGAAGLFDYSFLFSKKTIADVLIVFASKFEFLFLLMAEFFRRI